MPTKRNRRVGVQSRKVKKPKNVSRKLSVSGKAKKRRSSTHGSGAHGSSAHGSSTHGSGTRRRVQRGGDPMTPAAALVSGGIVAAFGGLLCVSHGCHKALLKDLFTKKESTTITTTD